MFLNIEGSSNNKALEMPIKLVAVIFRLQHQKTKQWRWSVGTGLSLSGTLSSGVNSLS
jgi:hypothetical protein